MTIQHGTAHTSYSTKAPGYDLRDTAVGGAIRHGNPEAVARFREILAARDVVKASSPKTEEKMETTTVAAGNGAGEIVDDSASRKFNEARKRPADPRPVTIEQAVESKKYTVLTDDQVRQAHAEYVESGDSLRAVARRWQVSDTTMSKRWVRLGLRTRRGGVSGNAPPKGPLSPPRPNGPKRPSPSQIPSLYQCQPAQIPAGQPSAMTCCAAYCCCCRKRRVGRRASGIST